MVEFGLDPQQRDVRALAHEFARDRIRPVAWSLDAQPEWPAALMDDAWASGFLTAHLPVEYGGPGVGPLAECLAAEELGWGCAGLATSVMGTGLAARPLVIAGSADLGRRYLAPLVTRPVIASFCLTEPGAGSDVASMRTTAVPHGDAYVLDGTKCFVTNAPHAEWFTVFARTAPGTGPLGISAFVVPRDSPGVHVGKPDRKLGLRVSPTATVTFTGTCVPANNLIGIEGGGFGLAMEVLDRSRPVVAALAVGIARAAFEMACDHATTRVQFGVPIADHEGIQLLIADAATAVDTARLLVWRAADLLERGQPSRLASAHAKRFAADAAMSVTVDAVQVFGGHGVVVGNRVEKLMRDAKIMQIYEGTSQIQRLLIAREIMRKVSIT